MQLANPFQMNDWGIKKFLTVILIIQLAVWAVVGLDIVGLKITFLRQVIPFVYLTYIPGIIILRILKLHKLGAVETLLYAVGLSIATLMFTGLLLNTFLPLVGISTPISLVPLTVAISLVVLALAAISYVRDREFTSPSNLDMKSLLSPPALFLYLLPFFSVFGTHLVNYHQNNIILMGLIVIIALLVILMSTGRFIPKNLYPLAVFSIALSMCLYRTLISQYVTGYDIHEEYQMANLVILNGQWDTSIRVAYNAILSIVMLAPFTSIFCDIALVMVFKLIYPLWFALAIAGIYQVFRIQTIEKYALMASFLFIAVGRFYHDIVLMPRQIIATLVLVQLIFTFIVWQMNRWSKWFLFLVFGISLAVSHYGLLYIYFFCFVVAWLLITLVKLPKVTQFIERFYSKFNLDSEVDAIRPINVKRSRGIFGPIIVILIFASMLTWYIVVADSMVFDSMLGLARKVIEGLSIDISITDIVEKARQAISQPSWLALMLNLGNILSNRLVQLFTIAGFLYSIIRFTDFKFRKEFIGLAAANVILYLATLDTPFMDSLLSKVPTDPARISHITFLLLSIFTVVGGMMILRIANRILRIDWGETSIRRWFIILALFFSIFFLYQTGFVWQLTESGSGSFMIGQESLKKNGDIKMITAFRSAVTPEQDVYSAEWISRNREANSKIYATYSDTRVHSLTSSGMIPVRDVPKLKITTKVVPEEAYLYLSYLNVVDGIAPDFRPQEYHDMAEVSHLYAEKNKIYSNGASEIYK